MSANTPINFIDQVNWNNDGLVPVIAQDFDNNEILMVAWMNRDALSLTVTEQRAVYWSRSRQKIWRKGEESGNIQQLQDIYLDCDKDVIILKVKQLGGIACHTGRKNCFYRKLEKNEWKIIAPVIKDPTQLYNK